MVSAADKQQTKALEVLPGKLSLPGSCAEETDRKSAMSTPEAGTPNGDEPCSECEDDDRISDTEGLWDFSETAGLTDPEIERRIFMFGAATARFGEDEEDLGGEDLFGPPQPTPFQLPTVPDFVPGALPGTEATGSGANGASQLPHAPTPRTPLGSPGVGSPTG